MSDETLASVDTDTADCRHRVRVRDIYLGFASAETVCVACGQAFDPEREQELRGRDQALQSDALRVDVEGRNPIGRR